jgi:hypothetical protein
MTLVEFTYEATAKELRDLAQDIRIKAARRVGIDAERLTVNITRIAAYSINGEAPYFRADTCEVTIDGVSELVTREDRMTRTWLRATMTSEHRTPDPNRLKPKNTYVRCSKCLNISGPFGLGSLTQEPYCIAGCGDQAALSPVSDDEPLEGVPLIPLQVSRIDPKP